MLDRYEKSIKHSDHFEYNIHLMADHFFTATLHDSFMQKARDVSSKWPLYFGSHRGRAGNLVGCIGELVEIGFLGRKNSKSDLTHNIGYDIIIKVESWMKIAKLGFDKPFFRLEIKTKDRTVPPKPEHEATVPAYVYNKQTPDGYGFISLLRKHDTKDDFTHAFRVGWLFRDEFDEKKYFVPKGPKSNGAYFWCDAWNVFIRDLRDPIDFP